MSTLKATKKVSAPEAPPLTPEEVQSERAAIGVPEDGVQQRAWIRYQLQIKGWSQACVARATTPSDSTVSVIYTGQRPAGMKAERVRRLTAEVIGVREQVLFPEANDEAERRAQEKIEMHDARRRRRKQQRQKARDE